MIRYRAISYRKPCYFRNEPEKVCFHRTCYRAVCREAHRRVVEGRLIEGAKKWAASGNLWFVTVYFNSNVDDHHASPHRFSACMTEITSRIRRWAKRENVEFEYARVNGLKSQRSKSPFQIHAHVLATWLPDLRHNPTPKHSERFTSPKLDALAKRLGLTVWVERAESISAVALYCAQNLETLDARPLPSGFNRYGFSRNWCKLTPEVKKELRMRAVSIARKISPSSSLLNIKVIPCSTESDSSDSKQRS